MLQAVSNGTTPVGVGCDLPNDIDCFHPVDFRLELWLKVHAALPWCIYGGLSTFFQMEARFNFETANRVKLIWKQLLEIAN